jgi:hypothetical protein
MSVATNASSNRKPRIDTTCVDVHALHKSATMFLFNFFRRLCEKQQFEFYSENNETPNGEGPQAGNPRNFCRCPIRTFDTSELRYDASNNNHRIFQIRDPRDILVSEYFSLGWIHPTLGTQLSDRRQSLQQMTIDEYVIEQSEVSSWPLEEKFKPLLERELNSRFEMIVTYEEMVTDFPKWAEKVLPPFGFRFPKLAAIKLAWRYRNEFKTATESMTHKRRITPGDHRRKLKPATIERLNQRFENVLTRFGYLK